MKYKRQTIREIFNNYSLYQDFFSQLNPIYKNDCFIIPFYGENDSLFMLASKMIFFKGLEIQASTSELVKRYMNLSIKDKNPIAYNLSHELKIATIASYIALKNQDHNIYEIGPGFGHGSLHYSRLIKEKNVTSDKFIYKLISIEKSKECYDTQ